MVKRILVGVDGSEGSRKAAAFALELAEQTGAHVVLVAVLELPRLLPFGPMTGFVEVPSPTQEHLGAVRAMLEEVGARLPRERVETRVETGLTVDVLCELADQLAVDLIVVGARGFASRASRMLLGSVSDRVVHSARRPVTVVH